MIRYALALLSVLCGIGGAFAYDTPGTLMEALYAPYLVADFDWGNYDVSLMQSEELRDLFAKDSEEAGGEVGRIDFDPYIDGQDYQITDLQIGDAKLEEATATVEVTFVNFDRPTDLLFTLVEEDDGWKVDDVMPLHEKDRQSLKALLSAPL
ncbi:MAG: DUF3828 domain-containing protein [Devosia sp.]